MSKRLSRTFSVVLVCAMLMTLVVSVTRAQDAKKVLTTGINMTSGDPNSLDPQLAQDNKEITVINELFVGLTTINEVTSAVEPGLAESWKVSDDGLTYTFTLRKNIPWVRYNAETDKVEQLKDADGKELFVTAKDVAYGMTRSLDPAQADPYAYVLAPTIKGGSEFNGGKGKAEDLGIKVVDDYTLEITSPSQLAFALSIYGLWMARPVLQSVVEEAGTAWTEPENTATYGPFALKEWKHQESITLVKNPFWPGTDANPQAKLDELVVRFLDDTTQLSEYEAGTMDVIDVPQAELDRIKADPTLSKEYSNGTQNCSYYYGFNVQKPPFDNVHIRLAFSYAIDRQSIVDNVTKAGQIPARWLTRPGNTAAPSLEKNPNLGVGFDTAKAKEELAAGLKDLGLNSAADLPAITLVFGNTTQHQAIAQAVQQMWKDTLGVEVQLSALDNTTYFTTQQQDAGQIHRSGWCADYPDANSYLYDVMRSDSSQNYGHFNDSAFDKLVDDARTVQDPDKRADLYAQAEDILVSKDGGIAPIYWYVTRQLTKPSVERTYSVTGLETYEKWDIKS
jgi:oligopeptide transport system substrate-binding protein